MSSKLLAFLLLTSTLGFTQAETPAKAPAKAKTPAPFYPLAVLPASTQMVPGAPEPVPGAFTFAVVPDTQYYAQTYPEIFHKQMQWIADNVAKYNIKFMIQVGDVTETSADVEWQVAQDAFKKLDGKLPWSSAPGNHDYGGRLQVFSHRSPFSHWLPPATFQAMPTFGGVYDKQPDKSDNMWHHFEANGRKWLIIGLEFGPREDVLRWAGDVIAAHPDHSAIIFTHAYLDPRTNQRIKTALPAAKDKTKTDETTGKKPDLAQGEDIWQKVASKHENVVMVLCGHASYTNHKTSTGDKGQVVQEMVVDYQRDINGGNGWMRLLQVLPDGKTVRCQDYSPHLDQKCTMPDRTYDFEFAVPKAQSTAPAAPGR